MPVRFENPSCVWAHTLRKVPTLVYLPLYLGRELEENSQLVNLIVVQLRKANTGEAIQVNGLMSLSFALHRKTEYASRL